MERKIGEIFEYNGGWYQCVEGAGCYQCAFNRDEDTCTADNPHCTCRSDKKDVVFKKLENVGEPYTTFVDKIVQNYLLETEMSASPEDVFILKNNELRLIAIEIKQNKEDMNKINLTRKETDFLLNKLQDILSNYVRGGESSEIESAIEDIINVVKEPDLKMDLKPFNLQKAKEGNPVYTRDGRKARIICFDRNDLYPIVALIECEDGKEIIGAYSKEGQTEIYEIKGTDLMMLSEKKEGWVNVYKNQIHNTSESAEEGHKGTTDYIKTIKVSWEE